LDFLKDILVNLLSDAIWAIGGFLFARFLFLKKCSLFRLREQLQKKFSSCDLLLKKSFDVRCSDMLFKKVCNV